MAESIFTRAATAARAAVGLFTDEDQRRNWNLLTGVLPGGLGLPPARYTREYLKAYSQMPWLRAVSNKIATSVASAEWKIYAKTAKPDAAGKRKPIHARAIQRSLDPTSRRSMLKELEMTGDLKEIDAHPLLDVLNNANSFQTGLQLRKTTQLHLDLAGESFWLKERDGTLSDTKSPMGPVIGVWPIPPDWILNTPTPTNPFYRVQYRSWRGLIPDTEFLWFQETDPANPYGRGTGTAQALGDELETDEYTAKHCHDDQTECLTRRGWVRGLDLTLNDEIATWNDFTGRIEYQRPLGLTNVPYAGPMHHWVGRSVDALVTPTHRLWVHHGDGVWGFEESQTSLAAGDAIYWRDAGRHTGGTNVIVECPPVARVTKRKPGSRGGGRPPLRGVNERLIFSANTFAKFLGYYVSEGSPDSAAAQLAQTAGRYVDDIRQAVSIFPTAWVSEKTSVYKGKPRHKWFVHHLGLTEWLRAHVGVGSAQKRLPAECFEWNIEARWTLLRALINGDGSWVRGTQKNSAVYVTKSQRLADDVQRLCVGLGVSSIYGSSMSRRTRMHRVNICFDTLGIRRATRATTIEYKGRVWCVTVPNERFFSRRNGRVMLGGNTKAFFYNRAKPDLLIYPKAGQIRDPDIKRLEQDWMQSNQGFWRAFKPYFMTREVGVHEMDQNFRAMQLVQLREFERDIILQTFGIPPEVLGVLSHSNRATVSAADYFMQRHVVQPRLEFLRTIMQEKFVPEFDDRIILDYHTTVEEDKEEQMQLAKTFTWALSINEQREMSGQEPLEGKSGDIYLIPSAMTAVASLDDAVKQAAQAHEQAMTPPPPPPGFHPESGAPLAPVGPDGKPVKPAPPKPGAFPPKKPAQKYAEDQARDDHGRWTDGGGGDDQPGGDAPPATRGGVIPGHLARFHALKKEWAQINNSLLPYLNKPNAPQVTAKMGQLKDLVKEMYTLKADPGGLEGIGLPGGPRDLVIIGAGPGGLAASVMGGTDGLDTLVIDGNTAPGGQSKFSSRIENYPGFPIGATGEHLSNGLYEQAQRVGADTKLGTMVTGMTYNDATGMKTLTLSNGETVEARAVIVAGGVEFRKMDFPGAESPSVIYADAKKLAQDGAGKPVIVLGGSNGAAQAALGAARSASFVTVLSRSPIEKGMSDYQVQALRSNPKISVIEGDTVDRIVLGSNKMMETLHTAGGRAINATVLGVFIGGAPSTKWLPPSMKLHDGKVAVDENLETSLPGVFAVGDIRHGSIGRIGAAVGDGQMAERNVFEYFNRLRDKAGV